MGLTVCQPVHRFEVWPYLERFAMDARVEIYKELGNTKPDFIIGNYRQAVVCLLHVVNARYPSQCKANCQQQGYGSAEAKCGGHL